MTCPSCASSKRPCHKCGRCNQCGSHFPQVPLSEQPDGPQKERGHQRQALTRQKALTEDDLRAALRRLQHAEVNMWNQCKTTNKEKWDKLLATHVANRERDEDSVKLSRRDCKDATLNCCPYIMYR